MSRRLFRGLRRREPRPRYDAIVVGAGIGGLVSANLLAREGLSTLLVEEHYMVGGYCSTFRRGGFTFDAATHFYPLVGNPETLSGRLLDMLGVTTRWVRMDPVDTFHFPDGGCFRVPADFEVYRRRLDAEFPHQRQALDDFFAEVRRAYLLGMLFHFRGRAAPGLERFQATTVRQALDRHFDDRKLILLLTADAPHWGSPPSRTSFVFDSMLRLAYFLGNYYPVGGSQAFADELARCFEERGGEILMSTRAERIRVAEGRVEGVDLETLRGPLRGRRTIAAQRVVSNADLCRTYEELLAPGVVPARELERIRSLRPSWPCYLTHVGLGPVDPQRLEAAQGYYWRSWDPDTLGGDGLVGKIFVPTLYEPTMAPPGKQIVILQKVREVDYDAVADWQLEKRQVEDSLLAHLSAVLPGIEGSIEVALTATARTARAFTANRAGAMLGWEMAPDQLGASRPGVQSPVTGLYLTGHWVRPGGGITPVLVSALHAAEAVTGRSLWPRGPTEAGVEGETAESTR